jgi:hypothetical protein
MKMLIVLVGLLLAGCVSVPPQVVLTHQKEKEIVENLRISHLAMVDAYVDQKLAEFETFYFQEYGPAYHEYWLESFPTVKGREFDQAKDFSLLYSDLVAEYLDVSAPIEEIRTGLKTSIQTEYGNALQAHEAISDWLESLQKLTDAQRDAADSILSGAHEGLSLDKVDEAVASARETVSQRMQRFTGK